MTRFAFALAALGLAAACSTSTETASSATSTPAVSNARSAAFPQSAEFKLAMGTVDTLVANDDRQTAIDRLTQLLGETDLTAEERAAALLARGKLRVGPGGYDVYGGVTDFEEVVQSYPDTSSAARASDLLGVHRGHATSLNFKLNQPETSRAEMFSLLFELGEHQEAIDLLNTGAVTPTNDELVAMYQIGYLCEGPEYTGPSFLAVDTDGTPRTLRFCDFGK